MATLSRSVKRVNPPERRASSSRAVSSRLIIVRRLRAERCVRSISQSPRRSERRSAMFSCFRSAGTVISRVSCSWLHGGWMVSRSNASVLTRVLVSCRTFLGEGSARSGDDRSADERSHGMETSPEAGCRGSKSATDAGAAGNRRRSGSRGGDLRQRFYESALRRTPKAEDVSCAERFASKPMADALTVAVIMRSSFRERSGLQS